MPRSITRRLRFILPFISAVVLLLPSLGAAGEGSRFDATIGYQNWSDADDLQADPAGSFDSGGFALELSYHTLGPGSPTRWLWGVTLGVMGHDSSITGLIESEDLQLSSVYLGPSVKWILNDSPDWTAFLDLGAGYYYASIDEYSQDCYWDCEIYEYYDDSSFGGFVGLKADFNIGSWERMQLTTGIKAHFVDFNAPTEIGSQSELGGTIWQFHIGIATD